MFVFVLIHDCINSYCEWNSLLKKKKKNIFHSFLTIKTNMFFLSLKIFFFFFIITTQIWIFISKKHFFLHIPQNISSILTNQNPFFFYQSKQIWLFSKEETSFINKFVWFNFWCHMFKISFMTCMRWYIDHNSLEDQTLSGRNRCLTPSHSVT